MSAENAAEVNGGTNVSIKNKILENPSFQELSEEEVNAEIVSKKVKSQRSIKGITLKQEIWIIIISLSFRVEFRG